MVFIVIHVFSRQTRNLKEFFFLFTSRTSEFQIIWATRVEIIDVIEDRLGPLMFGMVLEFELLKARSTCFKASVGPQHVIGFLSMQLASERTERNLMLIPCFSHRSNSINLFKNYTRNFSGFYKHKRYFLIVSQKTR